jgi:hypothetical protein
VAVHVDPMSWSAAHINETKGAIMLLSYVPYLEVQIVSLRHKTSTASLQFVLAHVKSHRMMVFYRTGNTPDREACMLLSNAPYLEVQIVSLRHAVSITRMYVVEQCTPFIRRADS